uniref:Mucin-associated surface protein (MASP) n=1 Tax=Globodera pallida TaxID=36090 RepID=A0A183C0I8_GLOPA
MRTILFLAVLCLITASILETDATPATSPKKTNTSSKTGPASPGKTRPASPGQHGPASPGQHGPASPGKTRPASPGKTGPASPGKTRPASPGKTGPVSPGKTRPASPGQHGPASPGQHGPASPGQHGPASPGKHEPAAGNGEHHSSVQATPPNSPIRAGRQDSTPIGKMNLSDYEDNKSEQLDNKPEEELETPGLVVKADKPAGAPNSNSLNCNATQVKNNRNGEHHSSVQATPPNSPIPVGRQDSTPIGNLSDYEENKSEQLDNKPEEELETPGLVVKADKPAGAPNSNSSLLVDDDDAVDVDDDDDDDDDDDMDDDRASKLANAQKSNSTLLADDDDGDKDGMDSIENNDVKGVVPNDYSDSASNENGPKTSTMRDNSEAATVLKEDDPVGADEALKEPVVTE